MNILSNEPNGYSKKHPKRRNIVQVLKKLKPTLSPHLKDFYFGIALVLCTTLFEIAIPILLGRGVDVLIDSSKNKNQLYLISGGFLALIIFKALFESAQAWLIQRTGQRIIHDLRTLIFDRIHTLSIHYFDHHPTGRLVTRVINDIKALSELFTASISVLVLDVMIILGTILAMLFLHWKLACVVLLTFPIVFWSIWFFGERLSITYREVRAKLSEINAFLGENLGALATIQRLGAEKVRYEKLEKIVDAHNEAQMRSLKTFASVQPVANTLNGVAMASLIWVGGYWVLQGEITIGIVVSFLAYLRNLFQPIRDLVEKYNTFLSAMVASERIVAILDEPREEDSVNLSCLDEQASKNLPIRFEHVSFSYPETEREVLTDISFKVTPGTSIAIVGPTGSGKSSLIRLLLRYYEPSRGNIYFGDFELNQYARKELRQKIGVVHQDVYFFSGTIRENLLLGKVQITDPELIEICRRVCLWDAIESRGGLEMLVYEGGSNLSLGERQMLSFARVLLFDPPVLILDEATASIDRITEKHLIKAMEEGMAGRTSIIIAHRLTTISSCKEILVLEHGKIVERGNYEELLSLNGLFKKFHQIYSREVETEV